MKRAIGFSLVMVLLMVSVVHAAELVNNGTFDAGLTGWTSGGGTAVIDGGCGAGVARLSDNTGLISRRRQCINITSDGSSWTLSADMALETGDRWAATFVDFYSDPGCSGFPVRNEQIQTTSSTLTNVSNNFFFNTTGQAQSVQIQIEAQAFGGAPNAGCFDNISLDAPGATFVSLSDLQAQSKPSLFWPLIFVVGLGMLLVVTVLIRQRCD